VQNGARLLSASPHNREGRFLVLAGDATALTGMSPHQHADADLLAAAIRRDAKAFGQLVTKYHGLVYRVVWRLTNQSPEAEDIAQEAFLKLWNNPTQVRDAAALKGWLMRVAHNLVMDWFRHRPAFAPVVLDDVGDTRANAEERMGQDWVGRRVGAAIAQLPERQRLALTLAHFEQMPQTDAAAALELSVDAFESLLARARRALKLLLTDDRQDLLAALTEKD
jgi:RNA polymerase sigma-70 factor, ECF subfamily